MYGRKKKSRAPTVVACIFGVVFLTFLLLSSTPKKDPPAPIIYSTPIDISGDPPAEHLSAEGGEDAPAVHSPDELPEQLRKLYDKIPEARAFALGCLDEHDTPDPDDIDLDSLDLTEVPDLHQWDERWGYASYAGNYLGLSGCGPTCLSMAAIYLTGDTRFNPLYVAEYATVGGYYYNGQGTAWTLFSEGTGGLGVDSRELPLSRERVDSALAAGEIVALVLGPGDFTDSGHFILLVGGDGDGYVIRDPNDPSNTAKTWTYETLEPQIRNLWALS